MKKISLFGIILGFIAGALVAMISGTWIFWLALGLAIGVLLGAASARRSRSSSVVRNAGSY
jgi:F0F1-type ATP synthase assembly protein I